MAVASEAERCLLAICSFVSGLGDEVRVEEMDEFRREAVDNLELEAAELSLRCSRKLFDRERISSVRSNMVEQKTIDYSSTAIAAAMCT